MIPTVAEERMMAAQRRAAAVAPAAGGGRRPRTAAATLVFFFLAAIGVLAAHLLFALVRVPTAIVGFVAIGLAEVLIARKGFGTGVEPALWLCGSYSLIFSLPGEGKPEAALLFAAASALAGWRLRNPFFGALSAVFVVVYIAARDWRNAAAAAALVLAAIACIALAREWRRPSTEWLWIATLIAMIPAAFFAGGGVGFQAPAFLGVAAALLLAGLRMRHHAPLVAAAVAVGIGGGEWFAESDVPLELLLAISGALLIAVALALSAALRGKTKGWVTTPVELTEADDALEHASILAAAPHDPQQEPGGRPQSGGSFGGGGATGEY